MGHSPWGRRESDTTERLTLLLLNTVQASQVAPVVKNPPARAGDVGSIPGLGRSPGGGHGNSLQFSCLENPRDRGGCPWASMATVHGVAKSQT